MRASVPVIARQLLGKVLCTRFEGLVTKGIIVETEAYSYRERGCHAYGSRMTPRNEVMFRDGGVAYVYLCYGIHEMMNIVTNTTGKADAVLLRAVEPLEGIAWMRMRTRKTGEKRFTSGPGKLTKALGISRDHNGESLLGDQLWVEDHGIKFANKDIVATQRIGIDYAGEDASLPWRFYVGGNQWVSKL